MNHIERRTKTLAAADSHMSTARHRFSLAVLACLRGAPDHAALVGAALHEVDLARAELRRLVDAALSGKGTYRSTRRRRK